MDQRLFPDPFPLLFFFLLFSFYFFLPSFSLFSLSFFFFFLVSFKHFCNSGGSFSFHCCFLLFSFFNCFLSLSLSLFATLVDGPIYMFLREISTVSFLRSSIVHEVFCLPSNPISVTFTGFPLPNFEDGFFTLTVIDRFHVGCSHVPLIGRSARDNRLGYWELDCEWITFNSALHFFGK